MGWEDEGKKAIGQVALDLAIGQANDQELWNSLTKKDTGDVKKVSKELAPKQDPGYDKLAAIEREHELRRNFKITKAIDFLNEMTKPFARGGYGEGNVQVEPKYLKPIAGKAISGFLQGLIPLDVIPEVKSTYDAMNDMNKRLVAAANMDPKAADMVGGAAEMAGAFYGIGKMFKYGNMGRSWVMGKLLPREVAEAGKATLSTKAKDIASRATLAAAIGVGYETGKGELKDIKQAGKTGGIWAGMEASMAALPYAAAGTIATKRWLLDLIARKQLWDGITEAWTKGLEKIPMEWAFGGKYGSNLAQYLIPASSRLKRTPEGKEALSSIEDLITSRYLIKEATEKQVGESAKLLNKIPQGQRLAYYLMQIPNTDKEFWQVLDRIRVKYGDEAADNMLTAVATSRKSWTALGKAATQTNWREEIREGKRVWVPRPEASRVVRMGLEAQGEMEAAGGKTMRQFTDKVTGSTFYVKEGEEVTSKALDNKIKHYTIGEGEAFFSGFASDDKGKYILNFLQRKKGAEVPELVQVDSAKSVALLKRNFKLLNPKDLAASGSWKKSYTKADIPLLKEETRLKNIDTYVPRIFTKRWKDLPADMQLYYQQYRNEPTLFGKREAVTMLGASAARFLKKHNLPPELVELLEPITDLCVLDYHGLVGARTAVMTARTFDSISNMPKVCMDAEEFTSRLASPSTDFNPSDWVTVPNDVNRYFKLAGKKLQRDVFMELESLVLPSQDAQGMAHRALIKWKGFKTIWSPKVHLRNSVSNVLLNATVGDYAMPPWGEGWGAYRKMAQIMHNPTQPENAAILREMAENKLFMGSFRQADLASIAPALDSKVENVFDYLLKGYEHAEARLARYYENEEKWAKGAKYLYLRTKGIEAGKAAEEALKSTFNYSDLPLFVKSLRDKWWGAPFATFMYKAVPAMLESAIKYPWRIGAIEAAIYGFNSVAANSLGMKKDEWDELEKKLPSYMKDGHYSPLPGRDSKGRIQWFDSSYLLPWGLIYTLREQTNDVRGTRIPGLGNILLTNPLVSTTASLMTNKKWNGEPIVHSFDDWPTAMGRTLGYVWEQAVPSLMIGGTDFKSILDTVYSPDAENALSLPQQVVKQLGFGIRPMSEEQIEVRHQRDVISKAGDIRRELKKRMQKHPEQADKEMEKAQKRLRKLLGEDED